MDSSALEGEINGGHGGVRRMGKTIIRIPNHLGDAVMAQPAVRSFVKNNPKEEIHLLLPEWAGPIYADSGCGALIGLGRRDLHGFGAVSRRVRMIREKDYDRGVLLTPSFSSALTFYLAGVRERFGFAGDGRGIFLTQRYRESAAAGAHRTEKYNFLLREVGGCEAKSGRPDVVVREQAKLNAEGLLKEEGMELTDQYMAISPRAVAESRRWGEERYSALAARIVSECGFKAVLVGTADDYGAGEVVRGDRKEIINVCGKTDIEMLAAILSGARLFIGNDSGSAHLAAAVDTALVVLSGADRPSETSPLSDKKMVIIKDYLECISCVKNKCPKKGSAYMRCMRDIEVKEVFEAVLKVLEMVG